MERRTIILKRHKAPAHIQHALDAILNDLEQYGRSITTNGQASRYLSYRLREPKNQEKIYFQWHKNVQKSVITLSQNTKLERISPNKIRLIHQRIIEKKGKTTL